MERLLAPRRHGWLLVTLATITVMYTWHATRELAVLIEAEPDLPEGEEGKGVLRLAEQNIARHLHIPQKLSSEWAGGGRGWGRRGGRRGRGWAGCRHLPHSRGCEGARLALPRRPCWAVPARHCTYDSACGCRPLGMAHHATLRAARRAAAWTRIQQPVSTALRPPLPAEFRGMVGDSLPHGAAGTQQQAQAVQQTAQQATQQTAADSGAAAAGGGAAAAAGAVGGSAAGTGQCNMLEHTE